MRALLFTALAVVVATASGIGFLALSPAPDRPSDSLTLVIETGSINSTRSASANKTDSSLEQAGNETAPAGEKAKSQSLDDVIAARLREAGERESAQQPSRSEADDTQTAAREDTPDPQAHEQAQQPSTASVPGASVTFDGPAATGGQSGGMGATSGFGMAQPGNSTPSRAQAGGGSPSGTVSITEMLAAELDSDDNDSAAQQASGDQANASGARSADTPQATASASDTPRNDEAGATAGTSGNDDTSRETSVTTGTTIAALDPQVSKDVTTSPSQPEEAASIAATPDDEGPEGTGEATAPAQRLSAADAPALPRKRGRFEVQGKIAIVLRGLGVKDELTARAIREMPRQVAMGFVPYGESLKTGTQQARDRRHDVLLQVPLEPEGYPENNPGPHTLLTSLSIDENLERLDWLLDRFDGIKGVTNYLGDKFASSPGAFAPMLMELKARGLIYVDDQKAANATTRQLARQVSLAYSVADVVIDKSREPQDITAQLEDLEAKAKANGSAIAVGHAHDATLDALRDWLGSLNDKGLVLVPITELTTPPRTRVSQSTGG